MFKKSDFLRAGFNEAWANLLSTRSCEDAGVPEFKGSLEELIERVVNGAFIWDDTPEGHLFWSAVDYIVMAGEIDKLMDSFPMPEDVVVLDDLLEMGEKARYKWLDK